jgi:hypothetical protein
MWTVVVVAVGYAIFYGIFWALIAWRMGTVVVTCPDAAQRKDAIRVLTHVCSGGMASTGVVTVITQLYELGILH